MENNVNELKEVVIEKKEEGTSKKKTDLRIVIILVALIAVGIGLTAYFVIHNAQVKNAIKEVTGNDIIINGKVVYLDGEIKDDKEVVQYAKPNKGDLIANIKIKGYGTITVRFFPEQAPLAVENFVTHAVEGYYDGLSFHRIIADFMIQGGDPEGTGAGGDSIWQNDAGKNIPFTDEYSKHLIPMRGALCMANAGANTNGSQFFIVQNKAYMISDVMNLRSLGIDKDLVNYYKENGGACWLYKAHTVFGQVIDGYDVLDKVAGVKTNSQGKPENDVIIESIDFDVY